MPEPVAIVAAALMIAASVIRTGKATCSLIQGLREAPGHIEELSAFNAILTSLHAVTAQEVLSLIMTP